MTTAQETTHNAGGTIVILVDINTITISICIDTRVYGIWYTSCSLPLFCWSLESEDQQKAVGKSQNLGTNKAPIFAFRLPLALTPLDTRLQTLGILTKIGRDADLDKRGARRGAQSIAQHSTNEVAHFRWKL